MDYHCTDCGRSRSRFASYGSLLSLGANVRIATHLSFLPQKAID
jgi:hypothetical protein